MEPWYAVLLVALVLACPLGMWLMMRRHPHGGQGARGGDRSGP